MKYRFIFSCRRWGVVLSLTFIVLLSLRQFRLLQKIPTISNNNIRQDHSSQNWKRVFYFDFNSSIPLSSLSRQVIPISEHPNIPEYVDFMSSVSSQSQLWEHDTCYYPLKWQQSFYPTCNILHERDYDMEKLLGTGYWRQGWLVDNSTVLKRALLNPPTSNKWDEFPWGLYKSQVESMCLSRLQSCHHVLKLYAWCATSIMMEGANETFSDWFNQHHTQWNSLERLLLGQQVAYILYEIHSIDSPYTTIAHNDFRLSNFLIRNNTIYAGDFNQAILLKWDTTTNDTCRYKRPVGLNNFAPPPERKAYYKKFVRPLKMDMYELGNVLYQILTSKEPKHDLQKDKGYVETNTRKCVTMPNLDSLDYHSRILYYAILACHAWKALDRPTSFTVWKGLEVGIHEKNLSDEQIKRLFDPSSTVLL